MAGARRNPTAASLTVADPFAALVRAALAIPASLTNAEIERCRIYVDILLLWSSRLSLTAAKSAESIILEHLLDSLYIVPLLDRGFCVADIGSGAGFPGIPLAIVCPDVNFILLEPRRKRANFLREVTRQTNLQNVEVLEQRAEKLDVDRCFDLIVARAVGTVGNLLSLSAPLIKPGGRLICMKGPMGRNELAAYPAFGEPEITEYRLPNGAVHLLMIQRRL